MNALKPSIFSRNQYTRTLHSNFCRQKELKPKQKAISTIRVDVHSHLLPNVDGGTKSLEESATLIARLRNLGFEKLILTPQIMSKFYPNEPANLRQRLLVLEDYLVDNGIIMELALAAEYYLDDSFMEDLLSSKELLSFSSNENQKYLLFETEYLRTPKRLVEAVKRIFRKGYIPVLVHPERYLYLQNNHLLVHELHSMGVHFQVNTNSFSGYYGASAKSLADYLSAAQMISFLGSDCHSEEHAEMLEKTTNTMAFQHILRSGQIINNIC